MGSNTELESSLYSTITTIDCDTIDETDDDDDDIYLPSPQDLACQAGGPPAAYIAQKWAEILIPRGQTLFGRRDIANCVLAVGKSRYFVHWQVLWVKKEERMGSQRLPSLKLFFLFVFYFTPRHGQQKTAKKKTQKALTLFFVPTSTFLSSPPCPPAFCCFSNSPPSLSFSLDLKCQLFRIPEKQKRGIGD